MNDLEISEALALAIGWKKSDMIFNHKGQLICYNGPSLAGVFDYKDWSVIGPIAARYDCFPVKHSDGEWSARFFILGMDKSNLYVDTPQKAIAVVVIGVKK